jgi:hypothetical protein
MHARFLEFTIYPTLQWKSFIQSLLLYMTTVIVRN